MLRGAIIGLGNIAVDAHIPTWLGRRDVVITAVTDVRPARRAEAASRLPGARWYETADDLLLEADVDFVDICTPPSTHVGLICAALRRSFHVLCEKPLVSTVAELQVVIDAAAAAKRVVNTVHNWHHAPIIARANALVDDGAIGRVTGVAWQTLRTDPAAARGQDVNWRVDPHTAGGGILSDHGWHVFYLVRRWLAGSPTSVTARLDTRKHAGIAVEDTANVRVQFPDGRAHIVLTWAADTRANWAEIAGTEGRIELRDDTLVLERGGEVTTWLCPPAMSAGSAHLEWLAPVVDDFIAAVLEKDGAASNLAEASLCATLESLARESSRRGGEPMPVLAPS
jgi:predicted dehydrogenase